jgi:tetratricopeptide (TPR) repeat protein
MSLGMFIVLLLCIRTVVRNFEWVSEDSLWTATLRESPEDPHSWNNMGDVYSRHGELQQSLDSFTEATKLDSNYADAYHNIGNTYIQMKDYDAAIPFFQKAVSLNPNLWQSYQDLAGIAVEKGNNSQALDYIEKALKIDPTNQTLKENEQMLQRATIHQ